MKRTCEGCKALYYDPPLFTCQLGYEIDSTNVKPIEDCPKPTTIIKLCKAKQKNTRE